MNLLRLLLPLLPELVKLLPGARQEARRMTRRFVLEAELAVALVLLLLLAAGFAIAAAYMTLAAALTPPAAAAIMALCLLVLGLMVGGVLALLHRDWAMRGARTRDDAGDVAYKELARLGRQIEAKPVQSVLIAAVVGVVAASLGRRS